ncbi:hypothetical protein M0804_000988 [Polistes exclamans]|nr:hypothetical protein M0804_000988 [Polistes exclamans]
MRTILEYCQVILEGLLNKTIMRPLNALQSKDANPSHRRILTDIEFHNSETMARHLRAGRPSHRTNSIATGWVKVAVTGQDAYGYNCERLTSINPGIYSSSAMGNV